MNRRKKTRNSKIVQFCTRRHGYISQNNDYDVGPNVLFAGEENILELALARRSAKKRNRCRSVDKRTCNLAQKIVVEKAARIDVNVGKANVSRLIEVVKVLGS